MTLQEFNLAGKVMLMGRCSSADSPERAKVKEAIKSGGKGNE